MEENIRPGTSVIFHYTGKLESGEQFDSSVGKEPLQFIAGNGNIIAGLEKEIVRMKKGEKRTIVVESADAYGERDSALTKEIKKGPIPEGMKYTAGTVIYLKAPDGQSFPATIYEVKEDTVVLDFNHPLAGKKLIFDVEIIDVK